MIEQQVKLILTPKDQKIKKNDSKLLFAPKKDKKKKVSNFIKVKCKLSFVV